MSPDALLQWGLWMCLHHQVAGLEVSPIDVLDRWHAEQPSDDELIAEIVAITHRTTVHRHGRDEWPAPRVRFEVGITPLLEIRDRRAMRLLASALGSALVPVARALLAADDPPAPPVPVVEAVVEPRVSDLGRPDQEDWRERISQLPPPPPRGQLSLF